MADLAPPLDQQIVDGIVVALRRIRKADGYHTDSGLFVLQEQDLQDLPQGACFLEVLDDEEEAEFQNCKRRKAQLKLTIAVNFPAGEVTQAMRSDTRLVLADIRAALASIDCMNWITGVTGLEIAGRSLFMNEAGSRFYRPELQVRATFHETTRSTR